LEEEVAFWLNEFGNPSIPEQAQTEQGRGAGDDPEEPTHLENPFPPGYGEDLLQ
jgi:hypothetical protein